MDNALLSISDSMFLLVRLCLYIFILDYLVLPIDDHCIRRMNPSKDNEFTFASFIATIDLTNNSDSASSSETTATKASSLTSTLEPIEVIAVDAIVLNVYLKFSYDELEALVDELLSPNEHLRSNDSPQCISTLHQYALESTREPIDMSNQSVRTTYRPNLFTRKNDAFGPWNFNFLLTLLELDYQRDDANKPVFPKVWNTTPATRVRINRMSKAAGKTPSTAATSSSATRGSEQDDVTLIGLLKAICRQNKCDETDAMIWLRALKGMIVTIPSLARRIAHADLLPNSSRGEYWNYRASSPSSGQ